MKKLRDNSGESLIETLTALLIATIVIMFLVIAIVTSAKVNDRVSDNDVAFRYSDTDAAGTEITLTVTYPNAIGSETCTVYEHVTADDADLDTEYRYYTYE